MEIDSNSGILKSEKTGAPAYGAGQGSQGRQYCACMGQGKAARGNG